MTALLFITIAGLVLTLLTFWVLNTSRGEERMQAYREHFAFESASELAINEEGEFYLALDSIKIRQIDNGQFRISWNLSRAKWEQACAEHYLKPDLKYIVLRIGDVNGEQELDMWIKSLAGQYKFKPEFDRIYRTSLGIKQHQLFYPILSSDPFTP